MTTERPYNSARPKGRLDFGRSVVVRYEELQPDPVATLRRTTDQILPIPLEGIEAAIETCRVERMRQTNLKMTWHVRAATVGDSQARLGEVHLAIFRERHADQIRALGYEVR